MCCTQGLLKRVAECCKKDWTSETDLVFKSWPSVRELSVEGLYIDGAFGYLGEFIYQNFVRIPLCILFYEFKNIEYKQILNSNNMYV